MKTTFASKKKILIRIGSLRHGGAEKVLTTFLKNLPENKYEIDLLLNLYSGKYLAEIPEWINVLYLNKGEMITTNRLQDLPKKAYRVIYQKFLQKFPKVLYSTILKNKKYDIEFAAIHGMRDEILNSPLKNSKKVVWIHNDLRKTEFHQYTDTEIRKFFGFDKILVISEQIKNDFESLARTPEERNKIVRISNPLDTEEILRKAEGKMQKPQNPISAESAKSSAPTFTSAKQYDHISMSAESAPSLTSTATSAKQSCNIPMSAESAKSNEAQLSPHPTPVFLSVGTVFPQKGFDRLLRVHKKLLDEGLAHRIQILGDGYDFENTVKLRKELGVEDTAEMLGFAENPYPYFAAADFYVLSSRYEGFPTVLFEAITLKKNIIATNVSGVDEMLEHGKLGMIVENSEEGIYAGMKKALTNLHYFEKYRAELQQYEMPFNLKNSVEKIVEVWDNL